MTAAGRTSARGRPAGRRTTARGWWRAGLALAVVVQLVVLYNPTGPSVGSELVATSISTGGDGGDSDPAAHPFLEINPHHGLIAALAALNDDGQAFKEDAVHLLLDQARLLDGEQPDDPRSFSDRLARVITRGLPADAKSG